MMIAAANHLRRKNMNYHHHVLFIGQDVDRVAGMMAYIQLSLLGCPGYIRHRKHFNKSNLRGSIDAGGEGRAGILVYTILLCGHMGVPEAVPDDGQDIRRQQACQTKASGTRELYILL